MHFVWLRLGCDTGVWLESDLVTGLVGLVSASEILGLLGLYKVRSGRGMALLSRGLFDRCAVLLTFEVIGVLQAGVNTLKYMKIIGKELA